LGENSKLGDFLKRAISMIKNSFFFILAIVFVAACKPNHVSKNQLLEEELIFQSGFEPGSKIIPRGNDADITGKDASLPNQNDWISDLDLNSEIGNFSLQYQGGDTTMRYAKIIREPANPENQVLHFWLNEPNVDYWPKGRIQANLYEGRNGLKEFYHSVRVFLLNDFNVVRHYPKEILWLAIAEFWNNNTWSQRVPYGLRITLGIGKPTASTSDLHFILDAEDCQLFPDGNQKYTKVWVNTNKNVKVPIGKWFTMDYYYKKGNQQTGRFYLAITPEGEKQQIIFDVRNFTHHTQDPNPDGVTDFNPMKLYTSKELIHYMQGQGKTLQMYWDDFKLWKDKRPL
jgi:hypothetical protein